jgi:hypothetical protein
MIFESDASGNHSHDRTWSPQYFDRNRPLDHDFGCVKPITGRPVGRGLSWFAFVNEEPHMRRMTENLSPADRRFYWKFVGSLFGFYGALMIVMVVVFVGNHLSKNRALLPVVAESIGQKLPAGTDSPMPLRHAAKYD